MYVCTFAMLFLTHRAKINKMMETLLLSVLIIAIAVALLCVKLLVRRQGTFTSIHIHDSKAMKERGIDCVAEQDKAAQSGGKAF